MSVDEAKRMRELADVLEDKAPETGSAPAPARSAAEAVEAKLAALDELSDLVVSEMLPQQIGVSESLIVVFERHATAKARAAAVAKARG